MHTVSEEAVQGLSVTELSAASHVEHVLHEVSPSLNLPCVHATHCVLVVLLHAAARLSPREQVVHALHLPPSANVPAGHSMHVVFELAVHFMAVTCKMEKAA